MRQGAFDDTIGHACQLEPMMPIQTTPRTTGWKIRRLPLLDLVRRIAVLAVTTCLCFALGPARAQDSQMMIRISEIAVHGQHLEQYKAILKEEAEASVRLEPGVIAIFPLVQRESDTEF